MAGLLDLFDNGDAQLGLGLLAAAAPRADGAGFGQRLMEGVNHAQSWKQQQKKQALYDLQMQEAQMRLEQEKRQRAQQEAIRAGMGQFFKPAQPALAPLMGDESIGIQPSAGRAAVAPSFDAGGASAFLAQNGAYEDALKLLPKPKEADYKVVGDSLVMVGQDGVKPVFTATPKPEAKTEVAKLFAEMNALPDGHPLRGVYAQAIQKATTHAPAATAISYGSPVPFELPGGGVGYAQPGNRPGSAPQVMTDTTGKPLLKPKDDKAMPVDFTKSISGLNELEKSLENYRQTLKDNGGFSPGAIGEKRANLKSAYTAVQMGLKNAMELGALAGPDVQILSGLLGDPTDPRNVFIGSSGLDAQVAQAGEYLKNRGAAVYEGHKVPVPDKYKITKSSPTPAAKTSGFKIISVE